MLFCSTLHPKHWALRLKKKIKKNEPTAWTQNAFLPSPIHSRVPNRQLHRNSLPLSCYQLCHSKLPILLIHARKQIWTYHTPTPSTWGSSLEINSDRHYLATLHHAPGRLCVLFLPLPHQTPLLLLIIIRTWVFTDESYFLEKRSWNKEEEQE